MKKLYYLLLFFALKSCTSTGEKGQLISKEKNTAALVNDFRTWWSYYNNQTLLSADFKPLDTDLSKISTEKFFDSLITGKFIPVKAITNDSSGYYYLHPLSAVNTPALNDIRATISDIAFRAYKNIKMEGKPLPGYHFTDLNGRSYTNDNTRNNWLVIKCWFINCVPCVAEMPALNKMANSYNNRKDILFVSLALDSGPELKKFLDTHTFNYTVVPNQKTWLTNTLQISEYPTHIIINKQGLVVKVVTKEAELKEILAKVLAN